VTVGILNIWGEIDESRRERKNEIEIERDTEGRAGER
jgi:hypothetical protein